MTDRVAIAGAGFSGTLLAINLLRHDGPGATLIERRGDAGRGVAYGAAHSSHVLNVRAANMSAFPDDPGHFTRWLEARGSDRCGSDFVARLTYGEYLREQLDAAQAASPSRLRIVSGDVVALTAAGAILGDGRTIPATRSVLAVGNLPPHTPPGLDPAALGNAYCADPWTADIPAGLRPDDTVVILGSGLTMVDIALLLDAAGFQGRIIAISRRGLLPRAHDGGGADWQRIAERPSLGAAALVAAIRSRGHQIGWRSAIDELRPFTQDMWRNADAVERGRFLRHLRPWWDVHRHRLAPAVDARIAALIASGRLTVHAGKLVRVDPADHGAIVRWRRRGADEIESLPTARIVNAIGPQGDLTRTTDPLLARLRDSRAIRPDAAHLGIDVDTTAAVIDADGKPSPWLHALGPMTRGAFWEIVAVPDIRAQAWSLARRLSNAHWVGGEGL